MRKINQLSFLLITFISSNSFASALTDNIQNFEADVKNHITLMQTHTQQLTQLSCDTQKDEIIQHWEMAYSNYLAISYMDLEVITKNSLNYSFAFWPDKKNLINTKMKSLLKENEITSELVDASSAPVKGYQAIEYLLFDSSQAHINCQALTAISQNLLNNIQLIISQLDKYPVINPQYLTADRESEGASVAFNEISNHLSAIIKKIETITNDQINSKLYFSDAWRSKRALEIHKFNLQNSIEYIQIMQTVLTRDSQTKINNEIKLIKTQLNSFPSSYFSVYESKNEIDLFNHITALNDLHNLFSNVILKDLNISLGFNNSDGD